MKKDGLKNKFGLNEWTGAVGDLGTTLPLAFALVVINGFPPERIFFLWGIVYVLSGWIFKVPLSVQPLKAMAVIAIAKGYSPELISSTAFFYGILFVVLSLTGAISWLQKWFSPALVKGIQLGIGLILAQKAIQLVLEKGFLLSMPDSSLYAGIGLLLASILILSVFQFKFNFPVALILIVISIIGVRLFGADESVAASIGSPASFTIPKFSILFDAIIYLILPQIPLTLGNAVYAANDACHTFWKNQSTRVNTKRLSASIGLSDFMIGLFGGFPVCHGAGGIGAHAQFGAKTGGATIIIGSVFILFALITPISNFLFFIPVPLLAAMLLFDSYRMGILVKKLGLSPQLTVAVLVGLISFITRNLTIALIAGLVAEQMIKFINSKKLVNEENAET